MLIPKPMRNTGGCPECIEILKNRKPKKIEKAIKFVKQKIGGAIKKLSKD